MSIFEKTMQEMREDQRIPECVEEVFAETLDNLPEKKRKTANRKWYKYAAAALVIAGTMNCLANPAFAAKLPLVGNIFRMVQEKVPFSGNYSEKAESLTVIGTEDSQSRVEQNDYSVTVGGVTFTASEVYCDGVSVFLTAEVTNDNGGFAKIPGESMYLRGSWNYEGEEYSWGMEYLRGVVVDDHTFVGMVKFNLPEYATGPKKLTVSVTSIGWDDVDIRDNDAEAHRVKGNWNMDIPFTADTETVKNIIVGREEKGYTLEHIILSKYQVTAQVTAPDKECYVALFTQDGEALAFESGSMDEDTGVNRFFFAVQGKTITKLYVSVWDDFSAWVQACKQGMDSIDADRVVLIEELEM